MTNVSTFKETVARFIYVCNVRLDICEYATRHTPNARSNMMMWPNIPARRVSDLRDAQFVASIQLGEMATNDLL